MPVPVLHASLHMMGGFAKLGCGPLRSWGDIIVLDIQSLQLLTWPHITMPCKAASLRI